jgi:hypothetical protein
MYTDTETPTIVLLKIVSFLFCYFLEKTCNWFSYRLELGRGERERERERRERESSYFSEGILYGQEKGAFCPSDWLCSLACCSFTVRIILAEAAKIMPNFTNYTLKAQVHL